PSSISKYEALPAGFQRVDEAHKDFVEQFGIVAEFVQDPKRESVTTSVAYDPNLIHKDEGFQYLQQLSAMMSVLYETPGTIRAAIWTIAELEFPHMVNWNPSCRPDTSACLHNLFEDSASSHPDRLAVTAYDGNLSYKQLNSRANTLAKALQVERGIRKGELIPLCLEKSCAMLMAILIVLKSGAGYVPIGIDQPEARVTYVVQEVRGRIVLASPLQAKSRSFPLPVIEVALQDQVENIEYSPTPSISPQDIAYVTSTSGTTGTPKGVVTKHGSARLSVVEHMKKYDHQRHGSDLRSLQYSSYTFDASVLDIFATLGCGGCLCVPSEEERVDDMEVFLIRRAVNFADLKPTIANLLEPTRLPSPRSMAIGGEMATQSVIRKWTMSNSPSQHFMNSYGPTEAAIGCAVGMINADSRPSCVGKQVGGSLWVVDEQDHDHLMPVSCRGELVISGPTLARGYLNNVPLTKENFNESSPWLSRIREKRFYKTGDIAHINQAGVIEVLGRKEDG
ncbi:MAG: hypothetical protein Q9219_007528, partial [cf. Caloplaca sp. 3 TL-2023]